ncbi:MAG: 30S ribosomal protein S11 [Patescibacteria group bacterium]
MAEEPKKPSVAPADAPAKDAPSATTEGAAAEGGDDAQASNRASGEDEAGAKKRKKKSKKHSLTEAMVTVQASYNNTIVTVTEMNGNVVCWASSGSCGFKGTRKATPYAASVAAETALTKAKALGVERVHVSVKGTGSGRDQAVRAVSASGVSIETISDKTAIAHNGCRPRKARRV